MFQAVKVDPKEGIAAAIARKKEQACDMTMVAVVMAVMVMMTIA